MKKFKYHVLISYGEYEGMKFWNDNGYPTVDKAVKVAQRNSYGSKFYIVEIIDWEAKLKGEEL